MWSRAYDGWLAFADRLQRVMTTLIFGIIYLAIVPIFALVMRTRRLWVRSDTQHHSNWISRRRQTADARFFERSG
jgi:hypothetical protein